MSDAPVPRIVVLDGGRPHEVFEVLGPISEGIVRVRSPFLFELGEELSIRVLETRTMFEAQVRVRAHTGSPPSETELEILERSESRPTGAG